MIRLSAILTAIFCLLCVVRAQEPTIENSAVGSDSLSVGFVTCYPGSEIFELYGHEAVRVSGRYAGQPIDVIFNYGLFDFNSPNFVGRFIKGETDYMSGVQPTQYFLEQYARRGSKVVERVLPLSQEEASELFSCLDFDKEPENTVYRYKYFTANCATKPLAHLNHITGNRFLPKGDAGVTYRQLLERYNEGYPWYQLGIDLVLGSYLDTPITYAQASFIPMEADKQYFGSLPIRELVAGQGDGNQHGAPTPWFLTPVFIFWVVFFISAIFIAKTIYRNYLAPIDAPAGRVSVLLPTILWTILQGFAGLLVFYLTIFSEHEGTSSNWNVVWLNPLWLFIPVLLCIKPCRKVARILCLADAGVTAVLLCIWTMLPQTMNSAQLPLMLTTIILTLLPSIPLRKH